MQFVAVLVVGVAKEVARLVVHHDAIVEGVEVEVAILPFLLLFPYVWRVQTSKLGNGRGLRGGELGVRRSAEGCRHSSGLGRRHDSFALQDMGDDVEGLVGVVNMSGRRVSGTATHAAGREASATASKST